MASIALEDTKVPVRFKLAALWTSVMFCYVYGDYFQLYKPGKLQDMLNGEMALGAVTQGMLVGTTILMAVPSLMIFLSLVLPAVVSRWLNVGAGLFYAAIMLLILFNGAWAFYMLFATIEVILTLLAVWYAWSWPRQPRSAAVHPTSFENSEAQRYDRRE
jgi:hypothetical protein